MPKTLEPAHYIFYSILFYSILLHYIILYYIMSYYVILYMTSEHLGEDAEPNNIVFPQYYNIVFIL